VILSILAAACLAISISGSKGVRPFRIVDDLRY
jgi:hypothetical protein